MQQSNDRRIDRQRLPLTITLDPATFRFVEECAQLKRFHSIDAFFEAVLATYREHVQAANPRLALEDAAGGRTFEGAMQENT